MLKTTLTWTVHMKTDKKRFEEAFYKSIKYENHPLSLESSAFYQGKVYAESSFFLEKRIHNNSMHLRYDRLDGKIIEDANSLLLELTLHPYINPFTFYTKAVIASVLLCYCVGGIPFLYDVIAGFFLLAIGIMVVPMFFAVVWLMKRIRRVTDLGLKAQFSDVLRDMQMEAERGGHIPIY